ncbi:MAG: glycosyltransferase [Candidatus Zapsychrus exili]|nr:glycosyltransferase [Candidatus Zapsychrus exili]
MNNLKVSVVIPAYNCEKNISKTLNAVLNQSYGDVELIVVDDESTDNTRNLVSNFKDVKYFYQKNQGPAQARNFGAKNATGEIVFFTDSDCVPQKDWIKNAIVHFDDKAVAVVSGSYGIANNNNLLARCIYKEILFRHQFLMPQRSKVFGSYNFGIRRNIFEEVGGFNTSYPSASGEDNDLSYKLVELGYKIYFEPSSLVDHLHPSDFWKYLKEQFRHGFWRVKMYIEHPKMAKGDDYTFWKDIFEVPVTILILISLFLSIFLGFSAKIYLFMAIILLCIEIFYGILMAKSPIDSFFLSVVMFFRAFSRMLGFLTGFVNFCILKRSQENK